jgi:hypothetical protein
MAIQQQLRVEPIPISNARIVQQEEMRQKNNIISEIQYVSKREEILQSGVRTITPF